LAEDDPQFNVKITMQISFSKKIGHSTQEYADREYLSEAQEIAAVGEARAKGYAVCPLIPAL
jgi:hypothetical protein